MLCVNLSVPFSWNKNPSDVELWLLFVCRNISPELQENIHSLTNNAAILMNTKKPAMQGVGAIPGIVPRGGISATLPGLQGTMGNPVSDSL